MRRSILCVLFVFIAGVMAHAQAPATPATDCPANMVCLSREAAQAALEAGDKAKALEAELTAVKESNGIIRKALDDMRIEYTRAAAEASQLRQDRVADRAIIETLVKYTKKKCMPFSICF